MTRVAAAAYPLSAPADLAAWEAKVSGWVAEAAAQGARLLVFPEYGLAELAALGGRHWGEDDAGAVAAIGAALPEAERILARLAQAHGVFLLAGSVPVRDGNRLVNRAMFLGPEGGAHPVDKLMPTPWERAALDMKGGAGAAVFDTPLGRIGAAICYDSEFPLVARALAEAGATILLVPSCTETEAGYWRVRIGCQARALEGQMWVAQAPLIGRNDWAGMVECNIGAAGVFGPPDLGFPPDGVAALGGRERPGWTVADCDAAAVDRVRREGGVRPFAHWPEQDGRLARVAEVTLR